jgi:hypothetical protein
LYVVFDSVSRAKVIKHRNKCKDEDGPPSGLLRIVAWYKFIDVSKLLAASVIHPDEGGIKHHRNVGELLPDYNAQQSRKEPSSFMTIR